MAKLSGIVAVLNSAKTAVREIRDLGSTPIDVKAGWVLPFVEVRPALSANQYYSGSSDVIAADKVTRTWAVATYDYPAIDAAALNAALIAEGSVFRALGLVLFDEINKMRTNPITTPRPAYTMQQFLEALQANMR